MNDTFSKNLRKLRLDKQMTQEQVAEFGDAYRYDDFMAAVAEFERLEKEGPLIAEDYRSNAWLHMRMFQICRNKTLESVDKAMELCKEGDPEFYYKNKIFKVWFRAGEMGLGQQCIDE